MGLVRSSPGVYEVDAFFRHCEAEPKQPELVDKPQVATLVPLARNDELGDYPTGWSGSEATATPDFLTINNMRR